MLVPFLPPLSPNHSPNHSNDDDDDHARNLGWSSSSSGIRSSTVAAESSSSAMIGGGVLSSYAATTAAATMNDTAVSALSPPDSFEGSLENIWNASRHDSPSSPEIDSTAATTTSEIALDRITNDNTVKAPDGSIREPGTNNFFLQLGESSATATKSNPARNNKMQDVMVELERLVTARRYREAVDHLKKVRYRMDSAVDRHDVPQVPERVLKYLASKVIEHPFHMWALAKFYTSLATTREFRDGGGDLSAYRSLYEQVCCSMEHLNPNYHARSDCIHLVGELGRALVQLDKTSQEVCFPRLLKSVLRQPCAYVGRAHGRGLYEHVIQNELTVENGYWQHLLTLVQYNRRDDIPYEDVLRRAADTLEFIPAPRHVLNALSCFFPFTDTERVYTALQAIYKLQKRVADADDGDTLHGRQFYVDLYTVEMIASAAANRGHINIILQLWDIVDILGYSPTEALYESTVSCFATNTSTYKEMYSALSDMEICGFVPSRALIREVSVGLR
jgi:hypothetical protein